MLAMTNAMIGVRLMCASRNAGMVTRRVFLWRPLKVDWLACKYLLMRKAPGRTAAWAIILIVILSGAGLAACASVMGEPVDVSKYCYEETPTDWDYCSWYYEESSRCWMCNPGEQ